LAASDSAGNHRNSQTKIKLHVLLNLNVRINKFVKARSQFLGKGKGVLQRNTTDRTKYFSKTIIPNYLQNKTLRNDRHLITPTVCSKYEACITSEFLGINIHYSIYTVCHHTFLLALHDGVLLITNIAYF